MTTVKVLGFLVPLAAGMGMFMLVFGKPAEGAFCIAWATLFEAMIIECKVTK